MVHDRSSSLELLGLPAEPSRDEPRELFPGMAEQAPARRRGPGWFVWTLQATLLSVVGYRCIFNLSVVRGSLVSRKRA